MWIPSLISLLAVCTYAIWQKKQRLSSAFFFCAPKFSRGWRWASLTSKSQITMSELKRVKKTVLAPCANVKKCNNVLMFYIFVQRSFLLFKSTSAQNDSTRQPTIYPHRIAANNAPLLRTTQPGSVKLFFEYAQMVVAEISYIETHRKGALSRSKDGRTNSLINRKVNWSSEPPSVFHFLFVSLPLRFRI